MKYEKIITLILFTFLILFGFETIVLADTLDCNSLGEFKTDLQNIFNFMKIVVPLLVIGLSAFDFIKAITGKDSGKALKKSFSKLIKRLILAIVFFFLPVLINLLLDLFFIDSTVCVS